MVMSFDTSVVCPVLIGRTAVLASFERVFQQVRSGQGQTVLVSGEAGIGKSRLVAEARARLGQEQMCFLQGQCFEQDRVLPFAPLLDMLRAVFLSPSRDAFLPRLAPFAPELIKLLPDLAIFLPDVTPTPLLPPQQEQRRLFVALTSCLLGLADHGPVLLILEDLHWSDDTSLEFLHFLTRHLGSRPLLLLLTYRSEEVSQALARFLSVLNRERAARAFSLTALTIDDLHAMLRAIFPSKRPVRRDFLVALYALTEGNPFFVEEVLKSLLAAGDIFFADGVWDRKPLAELHIPRSIRDAVQQRMSLLSEVARETLVLAAVIGRHLDVALWQAVTGRSEAELMAVVETVIAAQLIVEHAPGQYAFRHALTHQAVYASLRLQPRRALHFRVGHTMQHHYAASLHAHSAELAYHFYQAQDWPQALLYALQLGEQALNTYAPRAAIEHLTHGLEAANQLPGSNPIPLYRARGQAYEHLGDFAAALGDLEQALQCARTTRDDQQEWQCLMDLGSLWYGRDRSHSDEVFQQAIDLAQTLADPQKSMLSRNRLALQMISRGQPATAMAMLEKTRDALQQQGDLPGAALGLKQLASATFFYGDMPQAASYYDQAIAHLRAVGNKRGAASCLFTRSGTSSPVLTEAVYSVPGTLAAAQESLEEALRLANEMEWRAGQAQAHSVAGWVFASFGALGTGHSHVYKGLEIAREIESVAWIAGASCCAGEVHLWLLEPTQAVTMLEAGLVAAHTLGSEFWIGNITTALVQVFLHAGDLASAQMTLEAVMPGDQAPRNLQERRMAWMWGELALRQCQPERALHRAEALLLSAPGKTSQSSGQSIPVLWKLRGEALLAVGQVEEAVQALEEAKRGAQTRHAPHLLWCTHRALARAYVATKQRLLAHQEVAAAREIIADLAASIEKAEQRDRFVSAALASLPQVPLLSPRQGAKHAFDGLSKREQEVAILVAQGKASREMAEALVISQRTIETHVGHIYTKLGISSRAQLAAWAVAKGLAPAPSS